MARHGQTWPDTGPDTWPDMFSENFSISGEIQVARGFWARCRAKKWKDGAHPVFKTHVRGSFFSLAWWRVREDPEKVIFGVEWFWKKCH